MRDLAVSASLATIGPLLDPYKLAPGETNVATLGFPRGDPRRYGAPMNGVDDDTPGTLAAITNAIALRAGTLVLPLGTLNTLSNLVARASGVAAKSLKIKGYGRNTIIRPGPAVTVGLTVGGDPNTQGGINAVSLQDFALDMTQTTGAVGLLLGDNPPINTNGECSVQDVLVFGATGVGGYVPGDGSARDLASPLTTAANVVVKNMVGLRAYGLYSTLGTDCLLIAPSDIDMPTNLAFYHSRFRQAGRNGVRVLNGFKMHWEDCTFEANTAEGFYCVPTAGKNCMQMTIGHSWFEANHGAYNIVADGSLGGVELSLKAVNNNSLACKTLYYKSVANFVIDELRPQNQADDVYFDTNCIGKVDNWPINNIPLSAITNLSGGQVTISLLGERKAQDQQAIITVANLLVVDTLISDIHQFDIFSNAAYAVPAPLHGNNGSKEQVIRIKNDSGVALGAATWDAAYKLSEAWVNPTVGHARIIRFLREDNGGTWQQSAPSTLVVI